MPKKTVPAVGDEVTIHQPTDHHHGIVGVLTAIYDGPSAKMAIVLENKQWEHRVPLTWLNPRYAGRRSDEQS